MQCENKVHLTWEDYQEMVFRSTETFKNSKFDYIIALSRGGLPLGVSLSHALNVDLIPLKFSTRDFQDKYSQQELHALKERIQNKKILIVDDLVDSGFTLEALLKDFEEFKENITTFTWLYKDIGDFTPDYFDEEVSPKDWIVFPWEI